MKLILKPNGKTKLEKDPDDRREYEKWVYVLRGEIECVVADSTTPLKKGDSLSFDSRLAHFFQNKTSKVAQCIVVQNPRYI